MALMERPQQPSDDNGKDAYISDLSLAQQFEYTTTKNMLTQASKEQVLEFALKLLSYHMRYKNTTNAVVNEWGLKPPTQ